jgi:hypothetical protein
MFFGTFNILMGTVALLIGFKIYKPFRKEFLESRKLDYALIKILGIFFIFGGTVLIFLDLN